MEMNSNPISVEGLKSRLLQRRTTKPTFKLPNVDTEQTVDLLMTAVQAEVSYRHGTLQKTQELNEVISEAAKWLTGNVESHKCGLLLCGRCGNGKTTLMRAIESVIDVFDLKSEYGKFLYVKRCTAKDIVLSAKTSHEAFIEVCRTPLLGVDDLGNEPAEVMDYGNVLSPITDLIETRYELQLPTIVTTNLTPKEIRNRYGNRIADRFREMMHRVVFESDTYRGRAISTNNNQQQQ